MTSSPTLKKPWLSWIKFAKMLLLSAAAAPGSVPSHACAQEEMLGCWDSVWVPLWGRLWYNCITVWEPPTAILHQSHHWHLIKEWREKERLCFWGPFNVLVWRTREKAIFSKIFIFFCCKVNLKIYYWHDGNTNAHNSETLMKISIKKKKSFL